MYGFSEGPSSLQLRSSVFTEAAKRHFACCWFFFHVARVCVVAGIQHERILLVFWTLHVRSAAELCVSALWSHVCMHVWKKKKANFMLWVKHKQKIHVFGCTGSKVIASVCWPMLSLRLWFLLLFAVSGFEFRHLGNVLWRCLAHWDLLL